MCEESFVFNFKGADEPSAHERRWCLRKGGPERIDKQGWVCCTLTHNSNRGADKQPGVDAANPRANNTMGRIIRWKAVSGFDARTFQWNHLVLAGVPANERAEANGQAKGDALVVTFTNTAT